MKSGRYFFILFLILLIMPAYAQKGVDITGTVIEEGTNEPIEQATVRLLSVKDSSMIGGIATSRNGSSCSRTSRTAVIYCTCRLSDSIRSINLRVTGKTKSGSSWANYALTDGASSIGRSCRDRESTGSNCTQRYDGVQCRFL